MRSFVAAICAVLLVGLTPAGASLRAAETYARVAVEEVARVEQNEARAVVARRDVARGVAAAASRATAEPASAQPDLPPGKAWRAPSGPAPSRGPPALG